MKTIKQLSTELGISKEAIYKKLKIQLKDDLTGHIYKVDKVTHIDDDGELIIRRSIHRERREAIESVIDSVVEGDAVCETPGGQAHLTEYVNLLREQVKAKDIQIETQSGHIGQLIRQLGITQLTTHSRRLTTPPVALTAQLNEPIVPKKVKRGHFWSKIFKNL